jgi:hypothetical protein
LEKTLIYSNNGNKFTVIRSSLANKVTDVEMFTGDQAKLMSTFRSSSGFNHFATSYDSKRLMSTARLPDNIKPSSTRKTNEPTSIENNQLAYTLVSS